MLLFISYRSDIHSNFVLNKRCLSVSLYLFSKLSSILLRSYFSYQQQSCKVLSMNLSISIYNISRLLEARINSALIFYMYLLASSLVLLNKSYPFFKSTLSSANLESSVLFIRINSFCELLTLVYPILLFYFFRDYY